MKKALLTLTMVCALPISSLNAGWFGSNAESHNSTPQAQAKSYVDSAKKWGLAAVASPAIGLVYAMATLPPNRGDYAGIAVAYVLGTNTARFIVPSLFVALILAGKAYYNLHRASSILQKYIKN